MGPWMMWGGWGWMWLVMGGWVLVPVVVIIGGIAVVVWLLRRKKGSVASTPMAWLSKTVPGLFFDLKLILE